MLRIAVCDDEETVCSTLENYINKACTDIHIDSEIDLFSSGAILKRHLKDGNMYNIFFLDIELKDDTGIDVSDYIRNKIKDESAQSCMCLEKMSMTDSYLHLDHLHSLKNRLILM